MTIKPMLLVAEDDPDDQFLIREMLENFCTPNLETYYMWDGEELMSYLHENVDPSNTPDLVLLDLNMPRKDGRKALQEIKEDPRLENIPVVVLTTSVNERDALYCRNYGVAGYYSKPGSAAEMRTIIKGLCSHFLK